LIDSSVLMDFVRIEVGAMHALRMEQQIGEGSANSSTHFCQRSGADFAETRDR
jgi:hypothetical protein